MYYIYELIDPRNDLPFYVGKGKVENNRHEDHLKETTEHNSNRHKVFKINAIRDAGLSIPIRIIEPCIKDEDTAYRIEDYYILKYGRIGYEENGILTNICLNGIPPSAKGKKQTKEHIEKRVVSYKATLEAQGGSILKGKKRPEFGMKGSANPFYGKEHSKEFKERHSRRMTGNRNGDKQYLITDPNGNETVITGLTEWCKENKISKATAESILYKGKQVTKGTAAGYKIQKIG